MGTLPLPCSTQELQRLGFLPHQNEGLSHQKMGMLFTKHLDFSNQTLDLIIHKKMELTYIRNIYVYNRFRNLDLSPVSPNRANMVKFQQQTHGLNRQT